MGPADLPWEAEPFFTHNQPSTSSQIKKGTGICTRVVSAGKVCISFLPTPPTHFLPSTPLPSPSSPRDGYMPRGTTVRQLHAAKVLCDSAIHPDSGDIMTPIGRMSAQVPCGMVITGILLAYYKYSVCMCACGNVCMCFCATARTHESACTH